MLGTVRPVPSFNGPFHLARVGKPALDTHSAFVPQLLQARSSNTAGRLLA